MIKVIVLLVILFFALLFGHTLIGQEGMVLIALPDAVIELSIVSAIIVGFFLLMGLWLVVWLVKRLIGFMTGSRNWLGSFSKRQQRKAFHNGLQAYLIGDFASAEPLLEKSFGGDFSGNNYLLAADIDARIHQGKNVDALLIQAQAEVKSATSVILKQAQLALMDKQPQKVLEALEELPEKEQKNPISIQLKLQALASLKHWSELKQLIDENKKLIGDDYLTWAQRATHGEFAAIASKHGANALKEKWQSLSRAAKKDIANQAVYVQILLDQGLASEAEDTLVEFAKKQEHEVYWGLFKQLDNASPTKAISFIEHKIKQDPERAELYSVLAHLAYNSNDFILAQRAVNKAIEIERNQSDLLLLAAILEQQQSYEQANKLYKSLLN